MEMRRVLDFAQALVRQRTTRFRKLVRSIEEEETPPKWITDESFEHLQGFRALDGGGAENVLCVVMHAGWRGHACRLAILDDAWSCM